MFTGVFVIAAALLFASVCAAGGPIDPNDPPVGRFADDWGEVYMAGKKMGYIHSTMTRDGERIRTRSFTKIIIDRANQPVSIESTQATTETLNGAPLDFASEMDASVMKSAMRGSFAGGKVTITSSQFGMEQTQAFPIAGEALMVWGQYRASLVQGFEKGTTYLLNVYSPELRLDAPVTARVTVGDRERIPGATDGAKTGRRVITTLESPAGAIEMVSWVDADGHPLRAEVPMPGLGNIIIVTTSEAKALGDFVPPELFMTTVIDAKRTIDVDAARRITYRIRSKRTGVEVGTLPTTGMQSASPADNGAVKLVVTRESHKPRAATAAAKGNETDLSEYLESNLMINTKDPQLVKLAKEAAGGETGPYRLADRLRRFVTDYVTTKSLDVGFATASEVCRTRAGDCSEHGVLLAALGRINRLPSRVAVGLAYVPSFGGRKNVFGYHLWTQFFIDGRWIDVDAALRETNCSPTRIAFATSSLRNTGLADLSLPLLSKIGAIDIDILDIENRREK